MSLLLCRKRLFLNQVRLILRRKSGIPHRNGHILHGKRLALPGGCSILHDLSRILIPSSTFSICPLYTLWAQKTAPFRRRIRKEVKKWRNKNRSKHWLVL